MFFLEELFCFIGDVWMCEYTCIRGQGHLLVTPDVLGTDFVFRYLSAHRLEVIEIEVENVIERIHVCDDLWNIKAEISQVPPYDVAVPLLHIHVVVLLPWFASGEGDSFLVAPCLEDTIDELASSVGVQAEHGKRKGCPDVHEAFCGRGHALVPLRPLCTPIRRRIGVIDGKYEVSGNRSPQCATVSI